MVSVVVPKVMATHLNVNEVFGPTIQGEGPNAGQLVAFLRLAGCNLTCSWCDTPYSWDWTRYDHDSESRRTEIPQVIDQLLALAPRRIVVSGGEPLLQAPGLAALLGSWPDRSTRFDVETNGTRPLGPTRNMWDTIITSPKVGPSAGQWEPHTGTPPPLHPEIRQDADAYKFVVDDEADLSAVVHWVYFHDIPPKRVWLMPQGTIPDTVLRKTRWVADSAVAYGFNFSTRLHVLAWGDERAR